MNSENIHLLYDFPLIAVIGAALPDEEYTRNIGREVGYQLRKLVQEKGGRIFTGGVCGIGTDVCRGVVDYCRENKIQDSRFFVVYPDIDFAPPIEYYMDLEEIGDELKVVSGGRDMLERREILSRVADSAVVVNGSFGTLDEALRIIRKGKPIFPLNSSSGIAGAIGGFSHKSVHNSKDIAGLIDLLKEKAFW